MYKLHKSLAAQNQKYTIEVKFNKIVYLKLGKTDLVAVKMSLRFDTTTIFKIYFLITCHITVKL